MKTLSFIVKPNKLNRKRKFIVEMDASRLERLAANFGMFNPEFLKSIERAEEDYRRGRVYDVKSLEELRDNSN